MTWLDTSRIISIFAVILLHSAAGIIMTNEIGTTNWWTGNLYDSSVRWCVPVLVMLSGALLLDRQKNEDIKKFYFKRLSRIFIPTVFWSIFFLLWTATKGLVTGSPVTAGALIKKVSSGQPYYHMWFLYMIIFLYLFTPFSRKIIAGSSRIEIFIFIIFTFIIAALNAIVDTFFHAYSKVFPNWFLYFIPFFFIGHLIRTDEKKHSLPMLLAIFFSSIFLTAIGLYFLSKKEGLETGLYFYAYLSVTVIPMSISILYLLKHFWWFTVNSNLIKKLSNLSLGVYLIHPVFLEIMDYCGLNQINFNPITLIPSVTMIVFAFSLATAWLISRTPYLNRVI